MRNHLNSDRDKVVEVLQPNEALGFMSVIDGFSRTSRARVREIAELSIVDARKFRLMGRRGAELCSLHHRRHGSPNPRHECGDLSRDLPWAFA
jgi:CRP-like cAMP-binding protein